MTSKIDCVAGSGNVFADVKMSRPEEASGGPARPYYPKTRPSRQAAR